MASMVVPEMESRPKTEARPAQPPPAVVTFMGCHCFKINVTLRILFFVVSLVSVILMATSEQTKNVFVPTINALVPLSAKFDQTPAFTNFVVALSVASFYGIITAFASIVAIKKPNLSTKFTLHLAFWDAVMLGIVASALGAAGSVGYIGLRGNSYTNWNKICNVYDKFCQQIGASVFISVIGACLLLFLILLSLVSLSKRIPK